MALWTLRPDMSHVVNMAVPVYSSTYHPMGTATMGKVVDSKLRVIGVAGL